MRLPSASDAGESAENLQSTAKALCSRLYAEKDCKLEFSIGSLPQSSGNLTENVKQILWESEAMGNTRRTWFIELTTQGSSRLTETDVVQDSVQDPLRIDYPLRLVFFFCGTLNSWSQCISDSFVHTCDSFPPIGLLLQQQYEDIFLVLLYPVLSWLLLITVRPAVF